MFDDQLNVSRPKRLVSGQKTNQSVDNAEQKAHAIQPDFRSERFLIGEIFAKLPSNPIR